MTTNPEGWWRDARAQLETAASLKATGSLHDAYFHAGQAVEFALKAIYMRRKHLVAWPAENKGAGWHDLGRIAGLCGVAPDPNMPNYKAVYANWLTARDWNSNGRFPDSKPSLREVNDLITAVCNDQAGVMAWLEAIFQKS